MAGTFECPECGTRTHSPEWDGGKPLLCGSDDHEGEVRMVVVD